MHGGEDRGGGHVRRVSQGLRVPEWAGFTRRHGATETTGDRRPTAVTSPSNHGLTRAARERAAHSRSPRPTIDSVLPPLLRFSCESVISAPWWPARKAGRCDQSSALTARLRRGVKPRPTALSSPPSNHGRRGGRFHASRRVDVLRASLGRSSERRIGGTTCAPELAGTPAAPVSDVFQSAAAPRCALGTPGCRTLSRRLGGRRSTDMHLKRYQRQTVQEALRAVRADLGPDALVLSTRLVTTAGPRGWPGKRLVEVTAAADRPAVTADRQEAADAGREALTPAEEPTCA